MHVAVLLTAIHAWRAVWELAHRVGATCFASSQTTRQGARQLLVHAGPPHVAGHPSLAICIIHATARVATLGGAHRAVCKVDRLIGRAVAQEGDMLNSYNAAALTRYRAPPGVLPI